MPQLPRLTAAALLLLGAAGLMSARPLGWGGADAPDGTRYKASPVGLSHVLQPRQAISATRDCTWSPPGGNAGLCAVAPGGEAAFRMLRMVPMVVTAAALLCVLGAILLVVGKLAIEGVARAALTAAVATALAAPLLFAKAAPKALAALQGLEFGVGGTRGVLQLAVTAAVSAGIAGVMWGRRGGIGRWVGVGVVVMAVAGFLAMFPPVGGMGFAVGSVGVGVGVGTWMSSGNGRAGPWLRSG